jgi:hypothetical protein
MLHCRMTSARRIALVAIVSAVLCLEAAADVVVGSGLPSATTLGVTTATQWTVSSEGLGHALLLPYYSTQNGNATLFSITNTDEYSGKVVKVRIRGAANGDSLLSLTVVLAPADVWNAMLREGSDGRAELVTTDPSCTVPKLTSGVGQPLLTSRLNPPLSPEAKASHTREGYIEILEMADIAVLAKFFDVTSYPLACNDAAIRSGIVDTNHTTEASAASAGLGSPTGGIGGRWIIINVPQTLTFSGDMTALQASDSTGANGRANFVLFPQTDAPFPGRLENVTADPLFRTVAYFSKYPDGQGGTVSRQTTAQFHDLPDLSTPYFVAPADTAPLQQAAILSAALAVSFVGTEFANEPSISAKTDWTFSSPARRYSAAMDYSVSPARPLFSLVPPAGAQFFHSYNTYRGADNLLCTGNYDLRFTPFDRSGDYYPHSAMPMVYSFPLCGVVSVVSIKNYYQGASAPGSSVLSASVSQRDEILGLVNGWASLNYRPASPVFGHSFIRATNPSVAPGVSGSYGMTYPHWLKR